MAHYPLNPSTRSYVSDFPTQFPQDALQTILAFLRGQQTDTRTVIEAAYEVLGFGLGEAFGQGGGGGQPARAVQAQPPSRDRAQLAEAVEQALHQHQQHVQTLSGPQGPQGEPGQPARTWSPPAWLLPLALQVLQEILQQVTSRPT
jgi:hypothetical protein